MLSEAHHLVQNNSLQNIKVLELGTMIAAPFATHILAQLGAEVIKIEPTVGDPTRRLVRGGPSGTHIAYNRGKRSLCLNLDRKEAQGVFRKLLQDVDVVVHNLSPSAARRLKVTYEDVVEVNPEIIFCHIKGYGAGPLTDSVASNPIAEAATGVIFSHRVDGRPTRLGPSYHDQFAGAYAAIGILAALSDQQGVANRRIEFGLYETGLHIAARDVVGVQLKTQLTGKVEQEPSGEFSMPGYGAYETSDGRWIYLVMLTDEHWKKFWDAAGLIEGVNSELATLRQRKKHRTLVETLVKSAIKAFTFFELSDRLSAHGFGFTEVLSIDQVLDAPQARQPKKFTELSLEGFRFDAPDFPLARTLEGNKTELPPPLLGEHTREILTSLGYGGVECDALIGSGTASIPSNDKPLWAPVRPPKQ
jgi:crotonobetainyl-CoA:carnitine CoA-transferase CaiB-like acyl-CoA transferase